MARDHCFWKCGNANFLACLSFQSELANARNSNGSLEYGFTQNASKLIVTWKLFEGMNLAQGCLAVAVPQQSSASTPTAAALKAGAYFLWRFGVFLAANNLAHSYFPSLPIADSYEQHIAQNIAQDL